MEASSAGSRSGAGRIALIRVSSLAPIVAELDRRAHRAEKLMARHMLTRAQLKDPYCEIPLARYVAFLEDAAAIDGDPHFAARVGTGFRPSHLGPVGLLFNSSSSLHRGLNRLARFLMAWQGGTAVRVHSEEDLLIWDYRLEDPELWPRQQDNEFTVAATLAIARDAFGRSARPLEIHLEHKRPEDASEAARIFGLQPLYGAPANRLVFDLREADRPHRQEDRDLIAILERHVDDLYQPAGDGDGLLGKVRTLIGLHLSEGRIGLPLIAAELNISTRTLQRRLAAHDTSLRTLIQERRMELAQVHLRQGRSSNAEIARALGYSDSTAFWRAFKSHTGVSPSEFRPGR